MDTNTTSQTASRTYFRPTTESQRRLLFRLVEETGNVSEAARQAHLGRGTYYHWHSRYEAEGAVGLAKERSRAPRHTRIPPVSAELREEVLTYYGEHPDERGYRTIASRLRQAHGQQVIGHTKVGEIIRAARAAGILTSAPAAPAVPASPPRVQAVHAPQPNQTVNLDLCVVPLTHERRQALAAISLGAAAAGALPPAADDPAPADWPGQTFADTSLSYEAQMGTYVAKRTAKRASQGQRKHRRRQKQAARAEVNAQSAELRLQRRRQRLARRQEDAAWRTQRQAHREAEQAHRQLAKQERRARRPEWQAQQAQWQAAKAERHAQVQQRQSADAAWRQARQEIRRQLAELSLVAPLVTAWLAILVVIDNGTRRCLQLPLFTSGVHVTAEELVAALRANWPRELQFVISDNGAQFIAEMFARFASDMGFIHVRIAPYRSCTNGIAERFIRTLKEWLEKRTWNGPEELAALLAEFLVYYNDRPHQGAELAGLSPNEFTRQCLDRSTC
jgi:transposase InsO family protein